MTCRPSSPAEQAEAVVAGTRDAERLVEQLRHGCPSGDELHRATLALLALADRERLAGFHRRLQKALERAAP